MSPPYVDSTDLRLAIIAACRAMNASGINQGTSGNISVRAGDAMLITPSGIPYDALEPEMIVPVPLDTDAPQEGRFRPSTEWHFHRALLRDKPAMHAVVHAHPPACTALAINHREIPACHYMVAAFGGTTVPLAEYALFGTEALSRNVTDAMHGRHGCLMANHGAVVVGESLPRAMWRMEELETLARAYALALQTGTPHLLDDAQIEATLEAFRGYGPRPA